MAKSAGSKVIFVPMQLQSDVVGQMAAQIQQGETSLAGASGSSDVTGLTTGGRAAILNSMAEV